MSCDDAKNFANKGDIDFEEEGLVRILELLINAGYFRAKIQGLDIFDKIVGGMVWCISLCAGNVDVDILYSENITIGQKIALTEKIVEVLPDLKCPHSLQPHHIQGLNFVKIYPVIQWLVKEATFVRNKLGDETLNFAVYQFDQKGWKFDEELDRVDTGVLPLIKKRRKIYKKVIRMKHYIDIAQNEGDLFEEDATTVVERKEENDFVVQGTNESGEFIYTTGSNDEDLLRETSTILSDEKDTLEEQLLDRKIDLAKQSILKLTDTFEQSTSPYQELVNKIPKELIDQLYSLLIERDELKTVENAFKSQCRNELIQLDKEIQAINLDDNLDAKASHMMLNKAECSAKSLYAELAQLNKEIVKLSRLTEKRASQAEMTQYQRRFVELCNQMVSKHRETKRQYSLFNTDVDVRNFIRNEIDILDSIDRQRELALREEYEDSLFENLQKILKGVDESLDKKLCKKQSLQEQREQLQEQLQLLLEKHRLYNKTVVEFQHECQKNERYMQELNELGQSSIQQCTE